MSLRSLQLHPISTSHYYTSGDVTIQAGVAIAPGVLIQADPESRVVIKAGACIGIGVILHAHDGVVEIGEGANIGAEALLVGQVQVGAKACIGAATTIFNSNVESGQIIPPGSLIEDTRHLVQELKATDTVVYPDSESVHASLSNENNSAANATESSVTDLSMTDAADENSQASEINVYGQVYVNRMFVRMFPNHPRSQSVEPNEESGLAEADPWES